MPVSPMVNSYQMQNQNTGVTSAEQIFKNKFTDAAFTTLRAKYPQLASLVVTFKVLDADVDTGSGLAAFILRASGDVAYVPVVMSSGAVSSCEMLYDKASNSLMPLLPKVVQDVVNSNKLETAALLAKAPRVEDTRQLFKNMIRPPHSSNAVLASSGADISTLPNSAKAVITAYLESHPNLLAKIAEFYPIEVLASKLAKVAEETLPKVDYPDVVSIDALKEDTLQSLTAEEKETLLREGYAVRQAEASQPISVFPVETLGQSIEKEFNISEIASTQAHHNEVKAGFVFAMPDGSLKLHKALIASPTAVFLYGEQKLFSTYGSPTCGSYGTRALPVPDTILVSNAHTATRGEIEDFGGVSPDSLQDAKDTSITVFYPTKAGVFKSYSVRVYDKLEVNKSDDSVHVRANNHFSLSFSKSIGHGAVTLEHGQSLVFPYNSLVILAKDESSFPIVKSMGKVLKHLSVFGTHLRIIDDGAGLLVNDSKKNTTTALTKKASVAKHLVDTYGFGAEEVTTALGAKSVFVLDKTAFLNQPAIQEGPAQTQEQVAPFMQQQPGFAPQVVDEFAEMGDPDMMDTGILASFAQDSDIKENFVDLLPSFSEALTSVGRTILICSVQKKDMEDYYGREKYQTFVANCKRVFKTLGEIVVSLKEYINMNQ